MITIVVVVIISILVIIIFVIIIVIIIPILCDWKKFATASLCAATTAILGLKRTSLPLSKSHTISI